MLPKKPTSHDIDILSTQYDVTDAGTRLLQILADPCNRLLKMVDKCEMAGFSQDTYYRLWRDDRFKAAYKELCDATVGQAVLGSIQTIEEAAMRDPQAAIEMLKLSGYYQPTARVEHTHTVEAGSSLLEMYKARQKALD
jgi:hypothetical protein